MGGAEPPGPAAPGSWRDQDASGGRARGRPPMRSRSRMARSGRADRTVPQDAPRRRRCRHECRSRGQAALPLQAFCRGARARIGGCNAQLARCVDAVGISAAADRRRSGDKARTARPTARRARRARYRSAACPWRSGRSTGRGGASSCGSEGVSEATWNGAFGCVRSSWNSAICWASSELAARARRTSSA